MENASKALIIAGAVLVLILIVVGGVQVYNITGKGTGEQAKQASEKMWEGTDTSVGLGGGSEKNAISPPENGETYQIGEPVTITDKNGEIHNFYVIKDATEKVTLIAKDCIGTIEGEENYLKQSASANRINFSSNNYWKDDITSGNYNLIKEGEKDTEPNHYALYYAYKYGEQFGVVGRLMKKTEADNLNIDQYSGILYGTKGKSSSTYLNYWLGSVTSAGYVWHVNIYQGGIDFNTFDYQYRGVRPVIEILKSNI